MRVALVAVLLCTLGSTVMPGQSDGGQGRETRIQKAVREAKAKHHNKAVLTSPGQGAAMVRDVDDALRWFVALVVTPVNSAASVQATGDGLFTWYKFRIIAPLCKEPPVATAPGITPAALLPLEFGEILAAIPGGTMDVQGVMLQDVADVPPLETGKTYLVFLDYFAEKSDDPGFHGVGSLTLGPAGVFSVSDNRILPITVESLLSQDIHTRFDDRLDNLRTYAGNHCEQLTSKGQ